MELRKLFSAVKGGAHGTAERILSLRTEPLRCEIHCREASTVVRVNEKTRRATMRKCLTPWTDWQ